MNLSSEHVPAMPHLPLVGNLLDLRTDRLAFLLGMSRRCGNIGAFYAGSRPVILLNDPHLIGVVLLDQAQYFEKTDNVRNYLGLVVGNGLLTSLNSFHARQRRLMAPAFQHRRIASYADIITAYAERTVSLWTNGREIDVSHEMMRLTLSVVARALFDTDLEKEADEIGAALTAAMRYAVNEFTTLVHLPSSWPTPANRRFREARSHLDSIVYNLIQKRRSSGESRGDLLSALLQAHDEDDGTFMTDRQVRDEAMSILMAGHETTATALSWTWFLLAQHPEVYQRLRHEVQGALRGRSPTYADLPYLPYTLQVFKEAMRIYPPVWAISRQASRPVTIGHYSLPPGSVVTISPYVLHRRPDYFPSPERFQPERFAPEAEKRIPRHAYLPFADGPRVCIGSHFAIMEGHLVLATLAQRVILDLQQGQRVIPEPLITLRPRGGLKMRVRRL